MYVRPISFSGNWLIKTLRKLFSKVHFVSNLKLFWRNHQNIYRKHCTSTKASIIYQISYEYCKKIIHTNWNITVWLSNTLRMTSWRTILTWWCRKSRIFGKQVIFNASKNAFDAIQMPFTCFECIVDLV